MYNVTCLLTGARTSGRIINRIFCHLERDLPNERSSRAMKILQFVLFIIIPIICGVFFGSWLATRKLNSNKRKYKNEYE